MEPRSQTNRPISFVLMDTEEAKPIRSAEIDLIIRPEEMTRQEPSRNNVSQTLGMGKSNAWVDSFGRGLPTITMSGHTGWRGTASEDGEALFRRLRDTVFMRWHSERAEKVRNTKDPDTVQLVLADQLNDFAVVVVPQQFQLRRHKTRPLISQFQITMIEVADYGTPPSVVRGEDKILAAIDNPLRPKLAQESIEQNMIVRETLITDLENTGLESGLVSAGASLMRMTNDLLEKVNAGTATIVGGFDQTMAPLLSFAASVASAGANAFAILATPSNMAAHVKHTLMRIAGNFLDAYCNLQNGFRRLFEFPDIANLYGASACSSTGGGRPYSPWAQENPFLQVFPEPAAGAKVSSGARSALSTLGAMDGVSAPVSADAVVTQMQDVVKGVSLA